jgi:hypothetical protein
MFDLYAFGVAAASHTHCNAKAALTHSMTQKTRRKLFLADKNIVSCNDSFIVGGNWKFCQKKLFCLERACRLLVESETIEIQTKLPKMYLFNLIFIYVFNNYITSIPLILIVKWRNCPLSFISILKKPNNSLFHHNSFYAVQWALLWARP